MMPRQHKLVLVALVLSALVLGFAAAPAVAAEVKGKLKSVDKENAKLVVATDDKDLTIKVKEGCKITLDGEKAELADLKAGHKVTVTCEKDNDEHIATEVAAEKASDQ